MFPWSRQFLPAFPNCLSDSSTDKTSLSADLQLSAATNEDIKSIKSNLNEIDYPKPLYEDYSVSQKPPIACVLTEFHILLAYTDTIKGISVLNKEVVYEDNYNEAFGKLINIIKDPITGVIWAVTENNVFRYKVHKEERNVWQIYSENRQFDLAKKYSRDNPLHYNQVLIKVGTDRIIVSVYKIYRSQGKKKYLTIFGSKWNVLWNYRM